MNFNRHLELRGKHALLAPSQPYWLGYSDEQLYQKFKSGYAQIIGTALHELAETLISNNLKLKKSDKLTVLVHLIQSGVPRNVIDINRIYDNFMAYVNDAIGFKLTPEQPLYYSEHCFGTADAIAFRNNFLRIHDYKSGTTPAKMEQLEIYAALFCLEYKVKPSTIGFELRIYQNDEVLIHEPSAEDIMYIMERIVHHSEQVDQLKYEEA